MIFGMQWFGIDINAEQLSNIRTQTVTLDDIHLSRNSDSDYDSADDIPFSIFTNISIYSSEIKADLYRKYLWDGSCARSHYV